ncbi:hypothetical protein N7447_009687 [Penicillium robsamsonii]|uniref:uncharacterized protein n=1 Tax=Penicillium robsamsonii TaxID=1792511 RepID=UPI002546C353|nr:uncharacterized protein N7447_009687 [Penicillium robsamsonii]KAJ5817454.1 hypothetical protein N7447_009687 [Penicillium robsamsonii]
MWVDERLNHGIRTSVDQGSETLMQAIIEREFASHTVSFVCRLRYIERFDHVASMKQSQVVEWDVRVTM